MQTMDLSGTGPQSENRLKNLFWPTVRTATDVDSLGTQGYWVCTILAVVTLGATLLSSNVILEIVGVMVVLLYYVGGVGVRQHSPFAATVVFAYFLLSIVSSPIMSVFYVLKVIVCGILLSNVRAAFVASFWEPGNAEAAAMPTRFNETWGDKFVDKFPAWLWPKVRIGYYIYSILLLMLATLGLAMTVIARQYPQILRHMR